MPGDENNRNADSSLRQLNLQIHAAQPRHTHIQHQTSWPFKSCVLEKFFGGSKGLDLQSGCSNETLSGTTNRQIVINDKYDGLDLCHNAALPASGPPLPKGSGAAGRLNRKVAPGPWFGSAHNRPPWASMIERLIASPIPIPWGFVV